MTLVHFRVERKDGSSYGPQIFNQNVSYHFHYNYGDVLIFQKEKDFSRLCERYSNLSSEVD